MYPIITEAGLRWPTITRVVDERKHAIEERLAQWTNAHPLDSAPNHARQVKAELRRILKEEFKDVPREELMEAVVENVATVIINCYLKQAKKEGQS